MYQMFAGPVDNIKPLAEMSASLQGYRLFLNAKRRKREPLEGTESVHCESMSLS